MSPALIFVVCLSAFWGLFYLFNRLLQKMAPSMAQSLERRRIIMGAVSIGVETDIFTPYIVKFATTWRKTVHFWFLFGAIFCTACFALTMIYLLPSYIFNRVWPSQESPAVDVQVIIPGVTIPWAYVPHLMVAIFVTLAFHELGHALSGANDLAAIESIGLMIQFFIPAAYVRFKGHHYELSEWRQLKVYCAGSWHNFVLYALAWLILSNATFLYSPLYVPPSHGQTVSHIKFFDDRTPLRVGDKIIGLNKCTIQTTSDWNDCISNLIINANQTYSAAACIPKDWLNNPETECCADNYGGPIPCWTEAKKGGISFCQPARDVWRSGVVYCDVIGSGEPTCPKGRNEYACAVPSLQKQYRENGFQLLQIRVKRDNEEQLLHVRQHPYELLHQLSFVLYEPRWTWMPWFLASFADHVTTFCSLLVNFNLITPIISLLPIYGFDGEYVLYALMLWLFPAMNDDFRETCIDWVRKGTTGVGILIFASTLFGTIFS